MKCMFAKGHGGVLIPMDEAAEKLVASLKLGAGVSVDVKKARNIRFHRKFFSLLQLAFDAWEPPADNTHQGQPIQKDFERFREDVLILAGHYDAAYSVCGSVKLTAKSISFASCDDFEFERVYTSVLNVVWEKILRDANYRSQQEVDALVSRLIVYDS